MNNSTNESVPPWGLHWFRRDLHIPGNKALRQNWTQSKGRVLGLFCFDSSFITRSDFSHNRFGFFLLTLKELKKELQSQGGDLLLVDDQPQLAFTKLFQFFKSHRALPNLITWNRDYEPFARARDKILESEFGRWGIPAKNERDHLILEPWEVTKNNHPGDFYQVYSPFARRWFETIQKPEYEQRLNESDKLKSYVDRLNQNNLEAIFKLQWREFLSKKDFPYVDALENFITENQKRVRISLPKPGLQAAFQRLDTFKELLPRYQEDRDRPDRDGTSQLSIYLKNGTLTSAQILSFLKLKHIQFKENSGPTQYAKEIVWREFYYSILFHRPQVEHEAFLAQYKDLEWDNNESWFELWKEGQTGFPIVDAGMRQLKSTGWMHNRVRMIVASFLVKDLLIDWRWGERHFMNLLLDGDLAPNNGGWQWAASTGCDPQPYFRIFNPWLQGEKFDPTAQYIKTFVPELENATAQEIHHPEGPRVGYRRPMVQHAEQKERALRLFSRAAQPAKSRTTK